MKLQLSTLDDDILRWIEIYINSLKGLNFSKNTIFTYKNQLLVFYDFCVEISDDVLLKNIKQVHISYFFSWLNDRIAPKNSTKAGYLRTIRTFFNFISKNNDELYLFDYLFENLNLKLQKNEKKKINYMNAKECEKIINLVENRKKTKPNYNNYRNSLLVKLLMKVGLRISEALNLKMIDIATLDENFYEITILSKGGEIESAYALKDDISEELEYLSKRINIDDFIFLTTHGTQLNRRNAYAILDNIYKSCGIYNKSGCHILRHSFAMNLLDNNVNIGIIKKMLRHKDIRNTMIYADATPDMIKETLQELPKKEKIIIKD